ncbi:zinc ribbon domain-containing protein [Okeania hirsuta]|uniref:zinc ribbon domain-containing protein n=1 Tax=Okeania hirsuta TaxID=1458930 RepID=UPI0040557B6A
MLANHKLAKSISRQCFYEFRRQLEYKTQWYGSELVVVDRFFPSSLDLLLLRSCSRYAIASENL